MTELKNKYNNGIEGVLAVLVTDQMVDAALDAWYGEDWKHPRFDEEPDEYDPHRNERYRAQQRQGMRAALEAALAVK